MRNSTQATTMLLERAQGASYETIGARHGLHHEQVRRAVIGALGALERDLRSGRVPLIEVPDGPLPPSVSDRVKCVFWQADQLCERGLNVRVTAIQEPGRVWLELTLEETP